MCSTIGSTPGVADKTATAEDNDVSPLPQTGNTERRATSQPSPVCPKEADSEKSLLPLASRARQLSAIQQQRYLHLLTRGASPLAACVQLGISVLDVEQTVQHCAIFQQRVRQAHVLLSQNVAAALYRSAMEGSVPAQTLYLKNQPPPDWQTAASDESNDNPYNKMTHDELIALARTSGLLWPTEKSPGADPTAVAD
jgi:hypothetical protein